MSRVGKVPIRVPDKVHVALKGQTLEVKGPRGTLQGEIPPGVQVKLEDSQLQVEPLGRESRDRALHGLARALIANMVRGVTEGFRKVLEINGVGYRAALDGKHLVLELGFSHPIRYAIPEGVKVAIEKNTVLTVEGIDKQQVGDVAAEIRAFRPPEPYKGKGVRYRNEYVRRKEGKKNA